MPQLSESRLAQMAKARGVQPGFVPKPDRKPRKNEESRMQREAVRWFDFNAMSRFSVPAIMLCSIPNGGGRSGPRVGAILKAEGLRTGACDLMLFVARGRFHGLGIEMKTLTGRVSPEQEVFHMHLAQEGYAVAVCRSAEAAIKTITDYLKS